MPSTENTILANWQGPKDTVFDYSPVYHFALMQTGVNLDFHLSKYFRREESALHYFDNLEELITISRRFAIDAIIIGGDTGFEVEIELVRAIKSNVFLSIIPIILYHPDPPDVIVMAAFENGAEEFIHHEWKEKLVEVRIRKVIERSRRDLAVNPSTRLPGPTIIEREINSQLALGAEFAVCYADIDNFKAYNDYYGYDRGDRVIRLTARIIEDTVFDLCREGFVGHIAGDDFIYIIPPELVDRVCSMMIKTFDTLVPYRYKDEDRERGHITTVNRQGVEERFPLLTISISVIVNEAGKFKHVGELSKMLSDLKTATKQLAGSNYMLERREKY